MTRPVIKKSFVKKRKFSSIIVKIMNTLIQTILCEVLDTLLINISWRFQANWTRIDKDNDPSSDNFDEKSLKIASPHKYKPVWNLKLT